MRNQNCIHMSNQELSDSIERLKEKLDKALSDKNVNPDKLAQEFGLDISQFTPENLEKLKKFAEQSPGMVEAFSKSLLNPDNPKSKGVENISKKIKEQGSTSEKNQKVVNKLMGDYIKNEQTKIAQSCFHYDQQSCNKIIAAHSLQKKGPLLKIADLQNNQHQVLHFKSELGKKRKADLVAIKDASTFRGFCHNHDDIFSSIEQEPYTGSNYQNFLHSYRSFAYSYHMKLEKYAYANIIVNGASNLDNLLSSSIEMLKELGLGKEHIPDVPTEKTKLTSEQEELLKVERFEEYKTLLNEALRQGKYDDLEYFTYELNHICPIICASWVKLHFEIPGAFIIDYKGQPYNGYPLMFTIFHTDQNTSKILLARFKSDTISEHIFNQLRKFTTEELGIKFTSLIFEQIENFYLAPSFWNYLPQSEKDKIENNINEKKQSFPYKSTFKASINIFDKMHKVTISE